MTGDLLGVRRMKTYKRYIQSVECRLSPAHFDPVPPSRCHDEYFVGHDGTPTLKAARSLRTSPLTAQPRTPSAEGIPPPRSSQRRYNNNGKASHMGLPVGVTQFGHTHAFCLLDAPSATPVMNQARDIVPADLRARLMMTRSRLHNRSDKSTAAGQCIHLRGLFNSCAGYRWWRKSAWTTSVWPSTMRSAVKCHRERTVACFNISPPFARSKPGV